MNKPLNIRRIVLAPLAKRGTGLAQKRRLDAALSEFTEQAAAAASLPILADRHRSRAGAKSAEIWKDRSATKERVELALALYQSRKFSLQQYVFAVAHAIESFQDGLIRANEYPVLVRITEMMREIERSHGLTEEQYWLASEAPPEYQNLAAQWNAVEDVLLQHAFDDLEGGVAAELLRSDPAEFERLRERGRRTFFHDDEIRHAMVDVVIRYENEAERAAEFHALTAAITMLGGAMEGLLLLRCLQSKRKALQSAKDLPKNIRPGTNNMLRWTFDNLINVCLAAGWLPSIKSTQVTVNPGELASTLKSMRNQIHAGRLVSERPWFEPSLRDYEDARQIYGTIYALVFRSKTLQRIAENHGA